MDTLGASLLFDNKTHGEKLIYACRLLAGTRVVTLNTMVVSTHSGSQAIKGGTDEKVD